MFNTPLVFYRLDICVAASSNTVFEGWIGAVLRNNFLRACTEVVLEEYENLSLYEYLTTVPLASTHPLYKDIENGFPQAYYTFPCSHFAYGSSTEVESSAILNFSLVLIGEAVAKQFLRFVEAIRIMCKRGFGVGLNPFTLIDIIEKSPWGEERLIATADTNLSASLQYPIGYKDFVKTNNNLPPCISVVLETPMTLIKLSKKGKSSIGYQGRSNAFPSFYQLVRSAAHRLSKLNILYALPHDEEYCNGIEEKIEEYLLGAATLELEQANIKRVNLLSTLRKDKGDRIYLRGYVGELSFRGNYKPYLPLIHFMQHLGVGNELTYGFGRYRIANN